MNKSKENLRATRVIASTVGAFAGLLGIEHGIFEILQGYTTTGGLLIDAIGPQTGVAGSEPALTIIPNFFITSIIATIISIIVIIWAVKFIDRKHGGLILIILSIIQFLIGGGLAPISLGIIAGLVATRINKPLNWWGNPANQSAKLPCKEWDMVFNSLSCSCIFKSWNCNIYGQIKLFQYSSSHYVWNSIFNHY